MLRVAVLISGTGSNLRALLDAAADPGFPARIVVIGADRDADGLARTTLTGPATVVLSGIGVGLESAVFTAMSGVFGL